MRNGFFKDSELIKDEVDDMEECLGHYGDGSAEGRPISGRELSHILDVLRSKTVFSFEYDEANEEELFVIRIPLLHELLISSEVEQELFYQWGGAPITNTCDEIFDTYTEYCYSLSEILNLDDLKRIKRTIKRRLMKRFFTLFEAKNDEGQSAFSTLCDYFFSVGQGKSVADPRERTSIFSPYVERMAQEYAKCINEIVEEFSAEDV